MDYNSAAQYEQAIKIKKKGYSDYDSQRRYIARKGHREAYEQVAREEYQEPDPVPERGFKKIKVSQIKPEAIQPKSVKIQRYKGTESKAVQDVQQVTDKQTIQKVNKATRTRSEELQDIEDKAYQKQKAIEDKKLMENENAQAERRGARAAMKRFDRVVDWTAEQTEKPIDAKRALEEAKQKIMHYDERAKVQKSARAPRAPRVSNKNIPTKLNAAQKQAIRKHIEKAAKAMAPKARKPFSAERKKLPISKPAGNPFVTRSSGAPFAVSRKGNPLGSRRSGNPFGTKKKQWRL